MAKSDGGNFQRDFDYLMPFLDKVQAAGEALPPPARGELATLMAGERQRWQRIRELLAPRADAPVAPKSAPVAQQASPRTAGPFELTVGSLRSRTS